MRNLFIYFIYFCLIIQDVELFASPFSDLWTVSRTFGNGGFEGDVKIPVRTRITSGWKMTIKFNKPVKGFQMWRGIIEDVGPDFTYYVISNQPWNAYLQRGSIFDFRILGYSLNGLPSMEVSFQNHVYGRSIPTVAPGEKNINTDFKVDYIKVLQLSMLLFEAKRSGKVGKDIRIKWKGDSALYDGGAEGVDLTGGYYIGGDYVKFGFPMAFAMTQLAWGGSAFGSAYEQAGETINLLKTVKWGTDYFMKAHAKENILFGMVGDPTIGHGQWEGGFSINWRRPAFKLTSEEPGSDLAAETAAALASSALLFAKIESSYSNDLIKHAEQLYRFADTYRAKYDAFSIPGAASFYPSSGFGDELVWAALWLNKVTKNQTYLDDAISKYKEFRLAQQNVLNTGLNYDNKILGVQLLLAEITGKQDIYLSPVLKFCDHWSKKKGLLSTDRVKSAISFTANAAFVCALVSRQTDKDSVAQIYRKVAMDGIAEILGKSTGMSYMVGYGSKFPSQLHDRESSCPSPPRGCGWDYFKSLHYLNANQLTGAVVGGPDGEGRFEDTRKNFVHNQPNILYNSAFQSAVAGVITFNVKKSTQSVVTPDIAAIRKAVFPDGNFVQFDACISNPCDNSGECKNIEGFNYLCKCPPNVFGRNCENRLNPVIKWINTWNVGAEIHFQLPNVRPIKPWQLKVSFPADCPIEEINIWNACINVLDSSREDGEVFMQQLGWQKDLGFIGMKFQFTEPKFVRNCFRDAGFRFLIVEEGATSLLYRNPNNCPKELPHEFEGSGSGFSEYFLEELPDTTKTNVFSTNLKSTTPSITPEPVPTVPAVITLNNSASSVATATSANKNLIINSTKVPVIHEITTADFASNPTSSRKEQNETTTMPANSRSSVTNLTTVAHSIAKFNSTKFPSINAITTINPTTLPETTTTTETNTSKLVTNSISTVESTTIPTVREVTKATTVLTSATKTPVKQARLEWISKWPYGGQGHIHVDDSRPNENGEWVLLVRFPSKCPLKSIKFWSACTVKSLSDPKNGEFILEQIDWQIYQAFIGFSVHFHASYGDISSCYRTKQFTFAYKETVESYNFDVNSCPVQYKNIKVSINEKQGSLLHAMNPFSKLLSSSTVIPFNIKIPTTTVIPLPGVDVINADALSDTSVQISWNTPPERTKKVEIVYRPSLTEEELKQATSSVKHILLAADQRLQVLPSKTSLTIRNLMSGVRYQFSARLKGYNENGPSTTVFVTPTPNNVRNMKVTSINSTSVRLSWQHPKGMHQSYKVVYFPQSNEGSPKSPFYLPGDATSATVTGLSAESDFVVSITTKSGGVTSDGVYMFAKTVSDNCSQRTCASNEECENTSEGAKCVCIEGFSGSPCKEIDECATDQHLCHVNATCQNTIGSYKCSCNLGYVGDGTACFDIDECSNTPSPCSDSCINIIGSFLCTCKAGYTGEAEGCVDINECSSGTDICPPNTICKNTNGSYTCVCGSGMRLIGSECADVNECEINTHNCSSSSRCVNSVGSYSCPCLKGFVQVENSCKDIDECAAGTHRCHDHATCHNLIGGYRCNCNLGFTGTGQLCSDINECGTANQNCSKHATCLNTRGSYRCTCNVGFTGDGKTCENLFVAPITDNCPEVCDDHALCTKVGVSYECRCQIGYHGNGTVCSDIDECSFPQSPSLCKELHTFCVNVDGGFRCDCVSGWRQEQSGKCFDVDECKSKTHNCDENARCVNKPGGYFCVCKNGFKRKGSACIDINECTTGSCHPDATCFNLPGSYSCTCKSGYSGDGLVCSDVDECQDPVLSKCSQNSVCRNFHGSFSCTCLNGYTGNGVTCVPL